MPNKKSLEEKIEEVTALLSKYNGMPSQKDNKAGYSKMRYILKSHAEVPEIKSLLEQYGITITKEAKAEKKLNEYLAILERYNSMPSSTQEINLFHTISNFFRNNKDNPEILKLIYRFCACDIYPLDEHKLTRPAVSYQDGSYTAEYLDWRRNAAYEYIVYVYRKYQILPARNTKPMKILLKNIQRYYHFYPNALDQEELKQYVRKLVELGCRDQTIYGFFKCEEFTTDTIQERVRNLLIENGCCTLQYISKAAMPGNEVPYEFVFNYYYYQQNHESNFWDIRPLGYLFKTVSAPGNPFPVLMVHYRDYKKCDIKKIQTLAIEGPNWFETTPVSLEDWQKVGCFLFFDHKRAQAGKFKLCFDKTIIDVAIEAGEPYFRFYNEMKYLDYYLFLLQQNKEARVKALEDNETYQKVKAMTFENEESERIKNLLVTAIETCSCRH